METTAETASNATAPDAAARQDAPRRRRWWLFLLPLAVAVGLGAMFAAGLNHDPSILPSALLDKPAPAFTLPSLPGSDRPGLSRADLGGKAMLVNVFASWCVPCRVEQPLLVRLANQGVTIMGIDYKDRPQDVKDWLGEMGDPFTRIGSDADGRVAIDWGVYGVPETYVIDKAGTIVYKFVGPLQPHDLDRKVLPLLEKLK